MIIKLKNFRCFSEANFVFEENSNVLITSPSGFGKSSIFEAIKFALWGNRSSSLITFGKSKLTVSLTYKNYLFVRSKNSNSFEITNLSTDEKIQDPEIFINTHFKNYPMDFISLKSDDRMKILLSILYDNYPIQDLKDCVYNFTKEADKKLKDLETELNGNEILLESLSEFTENLRHPGTKNSVSNYRKWKEDCKKLNKKADSIHTDKHAYNFLIETKSHINLDESHECERLDEYISIIEKYNQDNATKRFYESKILDESIEKTLEQNKKDVAMYNSITVSNKEIKENIRRLSTGRWVPPLDELDRYISNAVQLGDYKCPFCNTDLNLINGVLTKVNVCPELDIFIQISSLYRQIRPVPPREQILKQDLLVKQIKESIEARQILKDINIMSESQVKDINLKISQIKNTLESKRRYTELNLKLEKFANRKFDDELRIIEMRKKELNSAIHIYENYDEKLKAWKKNNEKKTKCIRLKTRNKFLKLAIDMLINFICKTEKIKTKIEEAETISVSSLMQKINNLLKLYCSVVFNDEISVELKEYKEIKSNGLIKPSIEVKINYKGVQTKTCTLSSGEFARAKLILDLVIYKISKTNAPLMLDEVAVNLDTDISSRVFEFVIQNFPEVYIIAHQAVEGIFTNFYNEDSLSLLCKKTV